VLRIGVKSSIVKVAASTLMQVSVRLMILIAN